MKVNIQSRLVHHFIPVVLIFSLFVSGCLGPKKMNKWVGKQYGETINAPTKLKNDYITILSPLISTETKASDGSAHNKILPLLLYWRFDYNLTCALNTNIPMNTISSTILPYANSKGLKQKLNGQKIELTVEKLPNAFAFNDRLHVIWLILYAIKWDNAGFTPESNNLVVSYTLLKGTEIGKTGQVSIHDSNQPLQLKFMQSPKKAMLRYLEQYDDNMRFMSKKVMDAIISEL